MTSDDISSIVPTCGRSVRVHRRVEEKSETQVAHATTVDHQILRPSRSVDEEAVMEARATSFECHFSSVGRSVVGEAFMVARVHENDLEVREPEAARGSFPETAVVGFFRRRLDLHRSVR